MTRDDNPLLDFSGLPRYDALRPEHVAPAIDALIATAKASVARAASAAIAATWETFVEPLDDANERLSRAWGQVSHLHGVLDSPAIRTAYNENLPKVTSYWTELGQNVDLYRKYRELHDSPAFAALSATRRRIVDNALRDFRLGGAELPEADKPRYQAIHEELAKLSSRFSENLLDSTNGWSIVVTEESRLRGIPADVLDAAREAGRRDGGDGWRFTLHMPSYLPVMQYAEDRALRETVYREYVTRASELGKPEWDNSALMSRIVELRAEESKLLGYANFAERSLVPKMARTPDEVLGFLGDLARRARPFAERDLADLREFARSELGLATLEAWDIPFASERLRVKRYSFSEQEVKEYLPEDRVIPGMFQLAEALFGVRITPADAPVWHEDARFFQVLDREGALVGRFYMDLYARESKRGGAWMDEAMARRRRAMRLQTPVAYINCNFSPPIGAGADRRVARFTHDEVLTLFHEFGHALHHLLTRVEDLAVSGIAGVEWDAVELPSQFMENFGWERDVLAPMTSHVKTGEPLPRALFDKMIAAKNFQAGLQMLRQIEFAAFDMRLHRGTTKSALELLDEVRREVAVLVPPAYNRFPHSFSHIFGGGYAAGYYSYKWAEVLSADAFSAFEEGEQARSGRGVVDREIGSRFLDEILAMGGSRPAAESFRAFRGRAPAIDALLRHTGMIPA